MAESAAEPPEKVEKEKGDSAKKSHVGKNAQNRCVYIEKTVDKKAKDVLKAMDDARAAGEPKMSFSRLVNAALREYCDHYAEARNKFVELAEKAGNAVPPPAETPT